MRLEDLSLEDLAALAVLPAVARSYLRGGNSQTSEDWSLACADLVRDAYDIAGAFICERTERIEAGESEEIGPA